MEGTVALLPHWNKLEEERVDVSKSESLWLHGAIYGPTMNPASYS